MGEGGAARRSGAEAAGADVLGGLERVSNNISYLPPKSRLAGKNDTADKMNGRAGASEGGGGVGLGVGGVGGTGSGDVAQQVGGNTQRADAAQDGGERQKPHTHTLPPCRLCVADVLLMCC